ncbi:RES domain-containing protein [Bacteroides sp.]|jgi:hypothetical protein|uniref:RES domain-containing protein n=1 Tax=Bacteroides sp. TaxID=29523 RepID=UPI002A806A00|nr:RES domain-containing protein [Bacteroides sp.]
MRKEELYKKMISQLPVRRNLYKNMDYKEIVEKCFSEYLADLRSLEEQDKKYIWGSHWDEYFSMIENHINLLNEIIKLQYLGLHSQAYNMFKKLLVGEKQIINVLHPIYTKIGDSFYRMRTFTERVDLSYQDMFHIPLDKRGIVKTQRYSVPGYPCLYLGCSVYACWEEMRRPPLDTCMVSRFEQRQPSSLKFIDVTVPEYEYFEDNYQVGLILQKYPLIIACMIQVLNYNDTYKPEYIITQLLMEYIIDCRETNKNEDSSLLNFSGVYYTSVHKNDRFKFEGKIFNNVAIPVYLPLNGTKYCPILCNKFYLTEPTCEEFERIKISGRGGLFLRKEQSLYEMSSFCLVENALKSSANFPLLEMDIE